MGHVHITVARTRDSAVGQDMYISQSRRRDSGTCTYHCRTRDSTVGTCPQNIVGHRTVHTVGHGTVRLGRTCTYHRVGDGTEGHVHITVGHGTVQLGHVHRT